MFNIPRYNLPAEEHKKRSKLNVKAGDEFKSSVKYFPEELLEKLKMAFPDDDEIQSCKTLEEIYQFAGEPDGIGGSAFALDTIIKCLAPHDNELSIAF